MTSLLQLASRFAVLIEAARRRAKLDLPFSFFGSSRLPRGGGRDRARSLKRSFNLRAHRRER
jgi:hypothetical protein